jgi:hypothetical protein
MSFDYYRDKYGVKAAAETCSITEIRDDADIKAALAAIRNAERAIIERVKEIDHPDNY